MCHVHFCERGRKKLTLSAIDLFPRSLARSAERLRLIFIRPSPEPVFYLLRKFMPPVVDKLFYFCNRSFGARLSGNKAKSALSSLFLRTNTRTQKKKQLSAAAFSAIRFRAKERAEWDWRYIQSNRFSAANFCKNLIRRGSHTVLYAVYEKAILWAWKWGTADNTRKWCAKMNYANL